MKSDFYTEPDVFSGTPRIVKTQTKDVDIEENGEYTIKPDAGFSAMKKVNASVNVAGGGGGNYLPLSGGTMTGPITLENDAYLADTTSASHIYLHTEDNIYDAGMSVAPQLDGGTVQAGVIAHIESEDNSGVNCVFSSDSENSSTFASVGALSSPDGGDFVALLRSVSTNNGYSAETRLYVVPNGVGIHQTYTDTGIDFDNDCYFFLNKDSAGSIYALVSNTPLGENLYDADGWLLEDGLYATRGWVLDNMSVPANTLTFSGSRANIPSSYSLDILVSKGSKLFVSALNTTDYYVSDYYTSMSSFSSPGTIVGGFRDAPSFGDVYLTNDGTGVYKSGSSAATLPIKARYIERFGGYYTVTPYTSSTTAAYSTDAVTWVTTEFPSAGIWSKPAIGDGVAVSINTSGTTADAAYTTDGKTWTLSTLPESGNWYDIAYGNGKFVAVGASGLGAVSTDGQTWQKITFEDTYDMDFNGIAFGNGIFIAISSGTEPRHSQVSSDGVNWTAITTYNSPNGWRRIVYNASAARFYCIRYDGTTYEIACSSTGRDWSTVLDSKIVDASGIDRTTDVRVALSI